MKKAILLLSAILMMSFVALNEFSDGFSEGYCEGYKFVKGEQTVCPVSPVAPVPTVGQNTYKDGYNIGFSKGKDYAEEN